MVEFPAIVPPDEQAGRLAEARQAQLTKPAGSLGRLEQVGIWLAACQGACPPRPLARPRVVVFAGDHGVARHGVSAYPPEVTAQMVANFLAGGAAVNVLASVAGATVRVVDLAVDTPDTASAGLPAQVTRHKVRRSSGRIDLEDALTQDEVDAAIAAGRAIADEEVDSGADLLIAGDMGIGNTTPASVLVAAVTGAEPVAVVGRGTGVDDAGWMRKTVAVRDALRRARPVVREPVALLRTVGGADLAAIAGFLAQAAARRTPVLLDGLVVGAAALVADELAPGARAWWLAGHRSVEPAHKLVLERLGLVPLLDLDMRLGEGSGAVAALPLVLMAGRLLSEMATFADAGVSGAQSEADQPNSAEPDSAGPDTVHASTSGLQPPDSNSTEPVSG
ncbi:MAG TPA: nicotinate-nucleotide--dimethylbenzimidazole phosphoribosyltransferase [Pseudonocardia sp.]|uniref:nicotinate-nucleotide--dimethylbenzimidazole phosphoribosyltransferase n=1 Tax=Pseudonocardia sp. TaxID=60912 RepID=UPI002C7330D3|nr:nicotinate-nucleotide--dimethylbenzimidazole phosphoribosyltransferase [Pseudonocardia sp.]HTF46885.1 nicotinate-nucleotide--dimethylbenzimidazole phosphoribosyltransferase [Pseudonocardia sp.]